MIQRKLILSYHDKEIEFPPGKGTFTIGREKDNDLVLNFDHVSRYHGQIISEKDKLIYVDRNSTNGTYIEKSGKSIFLKNKRTTLEGSGRILLGKKDAVEILYKTESTIIDEDQNVAPSLFGQGYKNLKEGRYRQALKCFERVIEEYPQSASPYFYSGFLYSKLGDLDQAILRYEQYLILRSHDEKAQLSLGRLYEKKGRLKEAKARYRKVLQLNPGSREAQDLLGDLRRYEPIATMSHPEKSTTDILGSELIADVSTRHFNVTYNIARHGRVLNDILKILENAYQDVGKDLGCHPSQLIPVAVFTSSEELKGQGSDIESIGEDVAGVYGSNMIRVVVSPETLVEFPFLSVMLVHEYTHYLVNLITHGNSQTPWWLHEGVAQYESQRLTSPSEAILAELASKGAWVPLEMLGQGISHLEERELINLAYSEAYSLVEYLVERYGWDGIRSILSQLSKGKDMNQIFSSFGIDYHHFEMQWQQWLESRRGQGFMTRRI